SPESAEPPEPAEPTESDTATVRPEPNESFCCTWSGKPAPQVAMSFSKIRFHPGPRVASIVLNRPPLNIINLEMLDELNGAWSEIEDLRTQVVVISAAGDRAFSAGVDVADHAPGKIETMLERFHHLTLRIRRSDCVSIAAIYGHTLGGGAELATMCDLIIAADDAW